MKSLQLIFILLLVPIHLWILLNAALEFFPEFNWKVVDDLQGSDRFPMQEPKVGPSALQRPQRWKLHKAKCEQFRIQ